MSSTATSPIRFRVDPANPGQFFACCGLLELADRLWSGAEGSFEEDTFCIRDEHGAASLPKLLDAARNIQLTDNRDEHGEDEYEREKELDYSERETSPLLVTSPISLRLDWWGDKSIKTWAGSMDARKIFLAMCNAIEPAHNDPLNQGLVVFDAETTISKFGRGKRGAKPKKREPFYFDARRGASAWSIDVGFAPDSLKLTSVAYPVVESMCLVGLQRCRPRPTDKPRVFDYFVWNMPLSVTVVPAALYGLVGHGGGFRFENAFRTDQKKHKAFNPATSLQRS